MTKHWILQKKRSSWPTLGVVFLFAFSTSVACKKKKSESGGQEPVLEDMAVVFETISGQIREATEDVEREVSSGDVTETNLNLAGINRTGKWICSQMASNKVRVVKQDDSEILEWSHIKGEPLKCSGNGFVFDVKREKFIDGLQLKWTQNQTKTQEYVTREMTWAVVRKTERSFVERRLRSLHNQKNRENLKVTTFVEEGNELTTRYLLDAQGREIERLLTSGQIQTVIEGKVIANLSVKDVRLLSKEQCKAVSGELSGTLLFVEKKAQVLKKFDVLLNGSNSGELVVDGKKAGTKRLEFLCDSMFSTIEFGDVTLQ